MDDSQGIVAVDVNEPAAIAPTDAITHSSDDEETKSDHNSGVSGKHSDGEEASVLMVTSTPKAESEASEIKRGRGRPPKVLNKETIIENLDGSKVKRGRGRPPKVVTDTFKNLEGSGIKRGRGRPPKVVTDTFKNLDGSGIKRGRGRPPKVVTDTFKNLDGSGIKRGRGRPPKVVTDTFKNLDGSGIKRGRGRPPKVVNDETTTNTSTNSVMSSDSSADERTATLTSSVKRGRGRPRKDESIVNRKSTHDNDDHSNIEHEGNGYHSDSSDELLSEMSIRERPAPTKWKRGRPRKGEVREIIRVAESELDSSDGNDSDFTAEESNSDEDFTTAAYRPKLKKVKNHSDGTTGKRGRPRKNVVAARRGRPRKDVEAKQKRGRPRKETKVIRRESGESSSSGSSEDDDE